MDKPLSLLIVDVSESWEETLKTHERGYFIDFEHIFPGKYVRTEQDPNALLTIKYPHGSVRAGFNAIIDTARLAHEFGAPTYAVEYGNGWSDGEEQTCYSLQPYIPEANRFEKHRFGAFSCAFADKLKADGCQRLMVIGYDRDDCVLETIQDAVERGIQVVTSEHCMLTQDMNNRRKSSLAYFREHTIFLETLPEVWNYIRNSLVKTA